MNKFFQLSALIKASRKKATVSWSPLWELADFFQSIKQRLLLPYCQQPHLDRLEQEKNADNKSLVDFYHFFHVISTPQKAEHKNEGQDKRRHRSGPIIFYAPTIQRFLKTARMLARIRATLRRSLQQVAEKPVFRFDGVGYRFKGQA